MVDFMLDYLRWRGDIPLDAMPLGGARVVGERWKRCAAVRVERAVAAVRLPLR